MKLQLTLFFALALGGVGAQAQAFINANTAGSLIFLTIQDSTGVLGGGLPVKVGTPATAAGFSGAGPGEVSLTLYAALNGTALAGLESSQNIVATAVNSPQLSGTIIISGGYLALPANPGFDGSQPLEFIFFGVDATGDYQAWSAEATGIIPTYQPAPAARIFGTAPGEINSFNLILEGPEPSTFAIVGAGAAMLALLRRVKKN